MSNKFFGELLRQHEILENSAAPRTVTQRRQEMQQDRAPKPQTQQPGFFGRMKNYAGSEVNRAGNAMRSGANRALDSTVNTVANIPGTGQYNPINRASQWLGNKIGQWGKATPQLDGRIAQQNQINQNKYRNSDQYIKDTSSIYERNKQKAVDQYDNMIKQNNAKLAQQQAAAPAAQAPVARPVAPVQAPATPAVASVATPPAPVPTPYIRPEVNSAAQQVDRLRAEARARNQATAPRR